MTITASQKPTRARINHPLFSPADILATPSDPPKTLPKRAIPRCQTCMGEGYMADPDNEYDFCPHCGGSGRAK